MPKLSIDPQPTPNPNAMKFVTDRILNPGAATAFYTIDQAQDDAVARDFFALEGLIGLMIVNDFCTANKADDADWKDLIPGIESVMHKHWS